MSLYDFLFIALACALPLPLLWLLFSLFIYTFEAGWTSKEPAAPPARGAAAPQKVDSGRIDPDLLVERSGCRGCWSLGRAHG